MSYKELAVKIDKDLRKAGITRIQKSEIVAEYNINSDKRAAIWLLLQKLGWVMYWNYFELPTQTRQ